ncbi:ABC transporter [Variovorax paradoxus]|jgi:iron complex transport system ATP-binding protein|uniref:heme ABC transporter ATP-binding protein n=1 Tax=Variovorax paradoxus TaxID=34073 RepID=UPI0006E645D6|nr:ABC transporter [Variovorax paradoxus]KPU97122.1 ABC transporter [Variovorax paradoxus]KPV00021.1 ABC transporter [Variovorax paradoxus]KPV16082.1 ABC transporter [Variovorax paradoxus]KPV25447.1 ABC transporter [Variovorax paradoxus]
MKAPDLNQGLRCEDAEVRIGAKALLSRASVRLAPGRVTAILGPNGAGKSTLLSVLSGQREPTAGRVLLDGRPLRAHGMPALALRRALMPQESAVAFDFSARDVVALGRYPHRLAPAPDEDAIVAAAMALTDVSALAPRVLNTLSGGEKARVHMARVLAQLWHPRADGAARWLLLDEPTAALDLAHQHAAMRLLRGRAEQGVGVVVVLHDLNLARRYAEEVVVLGVPDIPGGLRQGPTAEVLAPPLIEAVWRMPCQGVVGADGTVQYLFG